MGVWSAWYNPEGMASVVLVSSSFCLMSSANSHLCSCCLWRLLTCSSVWGEDGCVCISSATSRRSGWMLVASYSVLSTHCCFWCLTLMLALNFAIANEHGPHRSTSIMVRVVSPWQKASFFCASDICALSVRKLSNSCR